LLTLLEDLQVKALLIL
jgi:hypothetical protein